MAKAIAKIWVALTLCLLSAGALTRDGEYNFPPLGWQENGHWVPVGDDPSQVCKDYAAVWRWDQPPYSMAAIQEAPGRWRCQRYLNGSVEPSWFTLVRAACQRNAAPILTGSDWSHPVMTESYAPPCSCAVPKKFDHSTEWCTGSPSCMVYPHNTQTECGRTVAALMQVSKGASDPTRLFHANQTCIARKSCDARCKMDNCNWLKAVLPTFADPYLRKTGRWSSVEARCAARSTGWLADRLCAAEMAAYHIEVDLAQSLGSSGCGSDSDWAKVFEVINTCSAETFSKAESFVATYQVRVLRDRTRAVCVAHRTTNGVNAFINPELQGRTCTP
jgi:hypothetical protein